MAPLWQRPGIASIMARDKVESSRSDQCMFGLVTNVTKTPVHKKTMLTSNIQAVHKLFGGIVGSGLHAHELCQGYEGGEKRCAFAQNYPENMCRVLVDAIKFHLDTDVAAQ